MKLTTHRITPEKYPWLLQQIEPMPKFLEVAGTIPPDDQKFLCVVGSRTPSSYGIETCRKLILELHGQPVVIISGMAIGIDSIAHEAAIDAELKTVAFPGSGLSPGVLYPPSRRHLAKRIIDSGGALISQSLDGWHVTCSTHSRRNARIWYARHRDVRYGIKSECSHYSRIYLFRTFLRPTSSYERRSYTSDVCGRDYG
jgi:predicted Rossmann fold nucleotide-binding protein DprA/Smf involved in DNA uptake